VIASEELVEVTVSGIIKEVELLPASVTLAVRTNEPFVVGVPEIVPDVERVRPAGRPVIDQV
jgi:hypothetical protein